MIQINKQLINYIAFTLFKKRVNISKNSQRNYRSENSSQSRRVVVTGLGAVTPLGNNVESSWNRLLKGECGINELKGEMYENLPCKVAGKVDRSTLDIESHFTKTDLKSMSTATLFSLLATQEALETAGLLPIPEEIKDSVGVCVGMGMFDLSDVYNSHQSFAKSYNRLSPYFIPRILPNMGSGQISIKYGARGPNHSVTTACATGAHSIGDGFRFIKHGDTDVVICGSGESCIDPLAIAGFCRLRALSTSYNDKPKKSSRPFDVGRDGFVMAEGAAILILEELTHAKKRCARIYGEILGYGLSGDAFHLTSPSSDGKGARLAMIRAIKEAGIKLEDIYYINAHATSTPTGDIIEAKAIESIFETNLENIQVSSTKGAHGHLLGAAGNLEALFTILACEQNVIPPSINIENLENEIHFTVPREATKWRTDGRRIALKNSFGFGGTNASLCIGNYVE